MVFPRERFSLLLVLLVAAAARVHAQEAPAVKPEVAQPTQGRDLTVSKCFQCHTEAMWRDQRLDQRAWQATLYRMVGRGAVWSEEEIQTMATFLATDFGPQAPRAAPFVK